MMAIQRIPITVQTSLVNVIMNINELNEKKDEKSYIIVIDDSVDVTIVGCECLSDVIFYADYFKRFDKPIDPEDMTVMRAKIADPTDLPFRLPFAASAFVLHNDLGINEFRFMYEATEYIESIMAALKDTVIEDFAVLIGIALSSIIKARTITKIEERRMERVINQVAKENSCGI